MIIVLNLFDIVPERQANYASYLRQVRPILERHGASVLVYGLTRMVYMGDCHQEYCGIIQYPSLRALKAFSHDPDFEAIRPLRDHSTRNYILTAIEGFPTMEAAATFLENGAAEMGS